MSQKVTLNLDTFSQETLISFADKLVISCEEIFYRLLVSDYKFSSNDFNFFSQLKDLNQYLLTKSTVDDDELKGLIQNLINASHQQLVNVIFTSNIDNEIDYLRKVGEAGYERNEFKEFSI